MLYLPSKNPPLRFLLLILLLLAFAADVTDSFVSFCDSMITTTTTGAATATTSSTFSSPTTVLGLAIDPLNSEEKDFLRATASTGNEEEAENTEMAAVPMDPRSCILRVGASAGKLCVVANQLVPELERNDVDDDLLEPQHPDEALTEALAELFASLWLTAKALRLDWVKSIRSKMALNAKKYPVEHCKGKAGKYTNYSHLTGITTTNQSTMDYVEEIQNNNVNHPTDLSLAGFAEQHLSVLAHDVAAFAEARQWAKYHKPRNLVLALLGEVGELAEVLQWEQDDWETTASSSTTEQTVDALLLVDKLHGSEPETLDELSQELADVSIYALRLATVCGLVESLQESLIFKQEPPQDLEAKQLFA